MAKFFFNSPSSLENSLVKPKILRWITLFSALFISIFLAIAAFGKFFYPAANLQLLDKATSLFEIVLIACMILFRMRAGFWLLASLVFAGWGGYAFYWCCLKLPCSCMGSMITLPSGYALMLDILFFALSCAMAFFLGARRSVIYLIFLCALLCTLFGYAFAEWIFYVKVVGVRWYVY